MVASQIYQYDTSAFLNHMQYIYLFFQDQGYFHSMILVSIQPEEFFRTLLNYLLTYVYHIGNYLFYYHIGNYLFYYHIGNDFFYYYIDNDLFYYHIGTDLFYYHIGTDLFYYHIDNDLFYHHIGN